MELTLELKALIEDAVKEVIQKMIAEDPELQAIVEENRRHAEEAKNN